MAGSIGKALFGGSDSKQTSFSGPRDVTPKVFKELREPFANVLQQLFGAEEGDPLSGIPQFEGPLAAPLGQGEAEALDVLRGQLTGPRSDLINKTIQGEFLTPETNPFLQAMIEAAQRPTLQGLTEVLDRTLPGRFTQAGQFVQPEGSSAFDRAAAIATRGAADALSDIATNIAGAAFESERGRQQEAIQLGQQEVETTINNLQAQALPRLIEDLGLERGLSEFQNRIQAILQALSVATGAPLTTIAQQSSASGTASSQRGITQGIGDFFSFGISR